MPKALLSPRCTFLAFPLLLAACGGSSDADPNVDSVGYDMQLLEEYRAALPESGEVEAPTPGPEASPNALSLLGDAELARLAIQSARDVNAPARWVVHLLRAITQVPPTLYDSEKKEFVWGPWDNEDDYGQVMAYIRENSADEDFEYSYAFVRLVDSDMATATPVIWGGATPGEDDARGVGVTLWDFEANNAFEESHDPEFEATEARDRGRFAMVYGRGEEDDGEFTFNVAVFRNFVSKDAEAGAEPADLDYFYGRFQGLDGNVLDFLDWTLSGNLCAAEPSTCFESPEAGAAESLNLRAAFINRGIGRAEATITDGDLAQMVGFTECWDEDIYRTHVTVVADGEAIHSEGTCGEPFSATLHDLGVPTVADLDAELLLKMDCVATNGLAACEETE